tara:strand:- start:956 stop:1900 length:945 start_codon:yes stop_codon:yes gene_type:complete
LKTISAHSFVTKYIDNNHPAFLIIPFRADDIFHNAEIHRKHSFDLRGMMEERYPGKKVVITSGARRALHLALEQYRQELSSPLSVRIQTTSDNFYISSCVTKTIEAQNKWHRDRTDSGDVLVANHEFGYPDNRLQDAPASPEYLIEDCAFSFNSYFSDGTRCGSIGKYALISFSKFFPIQLGGCLVADQEFPNDEDPEMIHYVENVVGYYFNSIEEWTEIRKVRQEYFNQVFTQLGCVPFFESYSGSVPGVYLFRLPEGVDKQKLKAFYWERGVQCSAFYGEEAFFLPLNQFTTTSHIDLFADIFQSYRSQANE